MPGTAGYEVFHDATTDAFGSGAWEYYSCPHATAVTDLGECVHSQLT